MSEINSFLEEVDFLGDFFWVGDFLIVDFLVDLGLAI